MQRQSLAGFFFDLHVQHHLAAIGELDGISQQVHDHLPQASGVADHIDRHIRVDIADKLETLAPARDGEGSSGFLQVSRKGKCGGVQFRAFPLRSWRNPECR